MCPLYECLFIRCSVTYTQVAFGVHVIYQESLAHKANLFGYLVSNLTIVYLDIILLFTMFTTKVVLITTRRLIL